MSWIEKIKIYFIYISHLQHNSISTFNLINVHSTFNQRYTVFRYPLQWNRCRETDVWLCVGVSVVGGGFSRRVSEPGPPPPPRAPLATLATLTADRAVLGVSCTRTSFSTVVRQLCRIVPLLWRRIYAQFSILPGSSHRCMDHFRSLYAPLSFIFIIKAYSFDVALIASV